jgi:succinoglycan biosynthesis transport protein ExoP
MPNSVETSPSRSTLHAYLGVLRRQWWLTALVALVAVLAGAIYTLAATPQYGASMKVVVGQGRALFGADVSGAVQPFTQTMTDLLQSDVVARQTIQRRHLTITPEQLLNRLSVTSNPDTSVLKLTYRDTDPKRAVATLGTVGDVFTNLVDARQGTSPQDAATTTTPNRTSATEPVTATVFDPAHALPGKVSPHTKRTLVLSLLLGLIAGTLLAFLRDALSGRLRNQQEAHQAFDAEVLSALPPGVLGTKPSQVPFLPAPLSGQVAESVQLLAASLRFSGDQRDGREGGVVVVTSARPEDGKSTVVAHLSAALARAGAWVVAVEADLHRPTLHRLLEVTADRPGLTDVLSEAASLDDVLVPVLVVESAPVAVSAKAQSRAARSTELTAGSSSESRLELLPAGSGHPHPAELLSLGTTAELVAELREAGDYVVVDTPPVLLSGDSFPLLQVADRVIVVCREGHTTREEAQAVRSRLKSLGVRNIAVVVTNSSEAQHHSYGYAYAD